MSWWNTLINFIKGFGEHIDQIIPELDKEKINMDVSTAIELLNVATKHGIPAVLEIMQVWGDDTPITVDTIRNATMKLKDAESYFEKSPSGQLAKDKVDEI